MKKFIVAYSGYCFVFMSYKILLYILSTVCDQVDEIISTDMSNNKNVLPNGTKDIVTTHDYNIGKEIVNVIRMRGGEVGITLTSEGLAYLISGSVSHLKKFSGLVIYTISKPISKALGFIIMKFPSAKKVYDGIKAGKVVIASIVAVVSVRVIARFDYWALILSDSLPQPPVDTKSVLSGIRRLRIGQKDMTICIGQSNEILNLVMDEEIQIERKQKVLINLFSMYELLPEHHVFKNRYFACIIHMLLALFIGDKLGFRLALRLLYRLLRDGKISLETYREILSQLVVGGVPTVDIEVV